MDQKEDLVHFIATKRDDSTSYTVSICCGSGLDESEFLDALQVFMDALQKGEIEFGAEHVQEIDLQ